MVRYGSICKNGFKWIEMAKKDSNSEKNTQTGKKWVAALKMVQNGNNGSHS